MKTPTKGKVMLTMNNVKTATRFIVGFSVGYVVGNVIKNNTVPTTTVQRAERFVGAVALGSYAAAVTDQHLLTTWNAIQDALEKAKQKDETQS